jgi:plasmid stabilization system protein ParE
MAIKWSDFALQSLVEIILWYEQEAGRNVADSIENRIFKQVDNIDLFPMRAPESYIFPGTRKLVITNLPYVAFIRNIENDYWEVVDIVHTSRTLPKNE